MKTFVLIVTFAATTDFIGGARTERIASFDDYQACASAGRALYSQQRWECVPENQHLKTHQRGAKRAALDAKPSRCSELDKCNRCRSISPRYPHPQVRGLLPGLRLSFVRCERCPHITQPTSLSPDGPNPNFPSGLFILRLSL
jgi:hypothetical protein